MALEHKNLDSVLTFKGLLADSRKAELSKIQSRLKLDFSRENIKALIDLLSSSLLEVHKLLPAEGKCDSTFSYLLGGCDTMEVINEIIGEAVEAGPNHG